MWCIGLDIFGVIKLFGGLALFLYGMSMLGGSLEKASGGRLEHTLEKMTNNVVTGVAFGALVTAAIQSSSATTVIVVGLVNARVLKLRNAIGVIMGANVGTTITAHILRLSDLQGDNIFLMLLKPSSLAPLAAAIGILLYMVSKRDQLRNVGLLLLGFSILFTGMFSMEAAVTPLRDEPWFATMFATFRNPVIGVLVGTFVTAAIQSSAASVGILQALSATGFITYSMAFPIIMGQNIGTCITPILASIGASKNAKRSAVVHVTFNILGTVVFLAGCYAIQYTIGFPFWDSPINKGGIANFHTIFNISVTLLFMPFTAMLERIACAIVRDKDGAEAEPEAVTLDERLLVSPGLAVQHVRKALVQMAAFVRVNYQMSTSLLYEFDPKVFERVNENEDVVDKLQDRVETYLIKLSEKELTDAESRSVTELLHVCEEYERMADHCENLAERGQKLFLDKSSFSKRATGELQLLCEAVGEIIGLAVDAFEKDDTGTAVAVEPLEQVIDEVQQALKDRHIDRLRKGKCTVDAAFPFVEALTDLERISDHCSNVGLAVLTYAAEDNLFDKHDYVKQLRDKNHEAFAMAYADYTEKYYNRLKQEKELAEKVEKADKTVKGDKGEKPDKKVVKTEKSGKQKQEKLTKSDIAAKAFAKETKGKKAKK